MSDEKNTKVMDMKVFEQFLREVHSRMGEFEIDSAQTTEFFNEAVKQVNERYPTERKMEYFQVPQQDLDDDLDE